jgi:hypothetical protein
VPVPGRRWGMTYLRFVCAGVGWILQQRQDTGQPAPQRPLIVRPVSGRSLRAL